MNEPIRPGPDQGPQQTCKARPVAGPVGSEQEELNRALVLGFYEQVIGRRAFDRWPEYLSEDYIQHKPGVAQGPQGVIGFLEAVYERYPAHTVEVLRSFVDGDYVLVHTRVHFEPASRDLETMDVYRVANGRLAEHWAVSQPI